MVEVQYGLLGPVEVLVAGCPVGLGGARQRTLLAALLLRAGRVVSADALIELVWGEVPPRTAMTALHGLVSKLRRALDPGDGSPSPLVSRPPGYVLQVAPGRLDLWECERLVEEAGRALSGGDAGRAAACFSRALSLWRGPALGGATAGTLALLEGSRLEELRLACVEGRVEAELMLGRHAELAPELESLVAEHPFRERLRGQHMLALYRLGRRAAALESYRAARATLVGELGLEPGPALRELERAILVDDPSLLVESTRRAPLVVLEQLPPDVRDFTGRERTLARLTGLLEVDTVTSEAPALVAVSGKPGVGKSALVVHAAHRLRDQFPDGRLFVSLRGTEAEALDPGAVLEEWLRALGVRPEEIPDELEARARAYRARVAGRRALVVLDDARDEAQIRPLLPGSGKCAVLVTSRRPLAALEGARFIALEPLDGSEAIELLSRVAGVERVAAEPVAAELIAERCGRLPLAVRVAGARLVQQDHWSLGELAARLEDSSRRLDELRVGDLEVRASVGLSYRALTEADRRAVRLLALIAGPPFAVWLAAAVCDMSFDAADQTLERLVERQLLDVAARDALGQVRYRFHDVLADFARERLDAEETAASRCAALARAYGACLALTDALVGGVSSSVPPATAGHDRWPLPDGVPAEPDQRSAFAWLGSERAVLVEMVERASRNLGMPAWELAANIGCVFEQSMRWRDWRRVLEAGRRAVKRDGDRLGHAVNLRGWGHFHNERGEHAEAKRCFEAARELLDRRDDPRELAAVLVGLADAHWSLGRPAAAIPLLERALELLRGRGETGREAWALYMLGQASTSRGRLRDAQAFYRRAIELYHRLGDLRGEAYASHGLGMALLEVGNADDAAACCERSQAIAGEVEDETFGALRYGLGYARRDQGRFDEALRELRAAHAVSQERDYKRGMVYALHGLGTVAHRMGRLDEGAAELQRGLAIAREMGDKRSTARLLHALGELRLDRRRTEEAVSDLRNAVELASANELRLIEANARASLARALVAAGAIEEAGSERSRSERIKGELELDRRDPLPVSSSR
jgi:DNA-binding SARP family transcriptional activator/tetratricopeptide (TPR) repeat protein